MTQSEGIEFDEDQQEIVTFCYIESEKLGKGVRVSEELWEDNTIRGEQDLFSDLVDEPVSTVKNMEEGQIVFVENKNKTNKCAYRIKEKDTSYHKKIILQPCVKNSHEIRITWKKHYTHTPVIDWAGQGALYPHDIRILTAPDMLILMEIEEHILATTINL